MGRSKHRVLGDLGVMAVRGFFGSGIAYPRTLFWSGSLRRNGRFSQGHALQNHLLEYSRIVKALHRVQDFNARQTAIGVIVCHDTLGRCFVVTVVSLKRMYNASTSRSYAIFMVTPLRNRTTSPFSPKGEVSWKNRESLLSGCLPQVLVEADEVESLRGVLSPEQGRCKLQRIRSS